jgi:hypothetical protein
MLNSCADAAHASDTSRAKTNDVFFTAERYLQATSIGVIGRTVTLVVAAHLVVAVYLLGSLLFG